MKRVRSPSGKALYRVLPRSVADMSAEQVAFHQRSRLQGAMVAAVAQNGYADTTIRQLVSLAGVSRSTFYKLFAGKEQCFLSTYDLIAGMASERIGRAYREPDDWREQLRAAFTCFGQIVAEEPTAAHLVLVDSLGVGPRVLERRERIIGEFEQMLRQSFERAPEPATVSDTTIHAIVAGVRRVAYRRLLTGEPERLQELVDELLAWALAYHAPDVKPPVRPPLPTPRTQPSLRQTLAETAIPPLDPALARGKLGHHERILHAVISLASEGGYPALSMPAIAARAGTSNETFYEHFTDKQDAFLTAFAESLQHAVEPTAQAFLAAPDWPHAVRAGLDTLLQYVVQDHVFARLAFFEILTGGPAATDRAEQSLDTFTTMLAPGYEAHPHIPEVVGEAIIGGLWSVIQREVGYGRAAQLPELTAELTYIVLTPFIGAQQAAEVAGGGARDT
jgi:AcrR family transcriptional regulator